MSLTNSRRLFVQGACTGFFGMLAASGQAAMARRVPQAKRCIVLWMNGGPSQFETIDPKPGRETGGEVKAIPTATSEIKLSEFLPNLAKQAQHLTLIKNVTSKEGEHVRAQYYLHTGFKFVPGFPRPAWGSVISQQAKPGDLPAFITLGNRPYGPAYLGLDHAPLLVNNLDEMRQLLIRIKQKKNRIELLQSLGSQFNREHPDAKLMQRSSMVERVEQLVETSLADALDTGKDKAAKRYGNTPFGQSCLAARRLIERGARFVEVQLDGWDTHVNNHRSVGRLCGMLDAPWAMLLDDLNSSGQLADTLVVWMGEFGRTPTINANRGRDHFPTMVPVALSGGGLAGGRVVGSTNGTGTAIQGKSHSIADLFATLFQRMGVSPDQTFTTTFGSPTAATDNGTAFL